MDTFTFTESQQKCMHPSSDYVNSSYDVQYDVIYFILHHCCTCRITTINCAVRLQTRVPFASHCIVKSHLCYSLREYLHATGWISTSPQGLLSFMLNSSRTLSPDSFGITCVAQPCWQRPPIAIRPAVNLYMWIIPFIASGPD